MANAVQFARVLAPRIGASESQVAFGAERLRRAGMIRTRGHGTPVNLDDYEIALVILVALLGAPAGNSPDHVAAYAGLTDIDGTTLTELLARLLAHPHRLVRLQIDIGAPHAFVAVEGDGAVNAHAFGDPGTTPRLAIVDGDTFTAIATAIRALPEKRSGRPATKQRFEIHT
jgi:hypothetical protein